MILLDYYCILLHHCNAMCCTGTFRYRRRSSPSPNTELGSGRSPSPSPSPIPIAPLSAESNATLALLNVSSSTDPDLFCAVSFNGKSYPAPVLAAASGVDDITQRVAQLAVEAGVPAEAAAAALLELYLNSPPPQCPPVSYQYTVVVRPPPPPPPPSPVMQQATGTGGGMQGIDGTGVIGVSPATAGFQAAAAASTVTTTCSKLPQVGGWGDHHRHRTSLSHQT